MPKESRVSPGELEARYRIIREKIAQGYRRMDFVRWAVEKGWNVTKRQLRNYYNDVYEQMSEDAIGVDRPAYFVRSLERLDYLYKKAAFEKDWKTCRQITMDVVGLLRLDTPEADYDWKKVAAQYGIKPTDLIERMKRLTAEEEPHVNEQAAS